MPDASPDRIWETLLGRQPTDQERLELIRIRDTLNLPRTDPVWILLIALQYFHSLYTAIPEEIRKASTAAQAAFQTQAETQAQATLARLEQAVVQRFTEMVEEGAVKRARAVARTELRKDRLWTLTAASGAVVILVVIGAVLWQRGYEDGRQAGYNIGIADARVAAYRDGRQTGYNAGIADARDEVAAANWANTKEGQMAQRLAEAGGLRLVAQCAAPGWRIQRDHAAGTVCFPYSDNQGLPRGWVIDPQDIRDPHPVPTDETQS